MVTRAKPFNSSRDESANEIYHGETNMRRNLLEPEEQLQTTITTLQTDSKNSAVNTLIDTTVRPVSDPTCWLKFIIKVSVYRLKSFFGNNDVLQIHLIN